MRASLKDIAEYTGLSKSAVSMHLNKHQLAARLSSATRAKIDEAVKKFNYVPSYTARALSSGKTRTIGFVVAELAMQYNSLMASALIDETGKHGVQLLISATKYSPEKEIKCLEDLLSRRADGIIYPLSPPSADTKLYNRLIEEHYPLVMAFNQDKNFHSVMKDSTEAMRQAVAFFRKSRAEEITIIANRNTLFESTGEKMYDLFVKACEESGCRPDTEPVDFLDAATIDSCLERIIRNPPDFMIVQGPLLMTVLKHKLHCCKNKLPRIINVIDNWEPPPLRDEMLVGVIMCYPDKIIKTAVDTLLRLINKPEDGSLSLLVKEPADFLLSWPGDTCDNTIDEIKRLMGYNGTHNWPQI